MNLPHRIVLLAKLGEYLKENTDEYQSEKEKASRENPWFTPAFIEAASNNIATDFLVQDKLEAWVKKYQLPQENSSPQQVGIVMAGNIPLVGFHDLLCVFITGHHALIKASSKDTILIRHLVDKLISWDASVAAYIQFADQLKGCDAYIATGSNNTGRYFEYYFGKYPHIIRYNRTSVAVLDGTESLQELEQLSDDIHQYFGLGCRNVTKLMVPKGYDFVPLLAAMKKYDHFMDLHKYKHNYDYHLALLIMGNKLYMTNGIAILAEHTSPFTPVSQVHYEYYDDRDATVTALKNDPNVQALVGHGLIPFGQAQHPALSDYADGVDTMAFLSKL